MLLKLKTSLLLFCCVSLIRIACADEFQVESGSFDTDAELPDTSAGFSEYTDDAADSVIGKDIVLVLDNSDSMKKSDPEFLTRQAAVKFVEMLGEGARIAMVIYDQDVRLVLPLTNAFENSKQNIVAGLERLDYQGLFTDSPSAIERALFELKNSHRESAQKVIIFVTDGSVDTGDLENDAERTRWLISEFAEEKIDDNLRFYGIALGREADQSLLQALSLSSQGESYLVQEAAELEGIFLHIYSLISEYRVEQAEAAVEPEADSEQAPLVVDTPNNASEQVVAIQPTSQSTMGESERIRSIIIFVAAIVLIAALLAIVILLIKRNRLTGASSGYQVEAYLNDLHGHTSQASYKLDSKPTMLGRVAGKDSEHLNFIVIPQSTIGRRHALIDYKDYGYWISDQGSINGTFVNDRHIKSEVRLKHGDRVRLHKHEFEFVMPETGDAGATVVSNTVFSDKESHAAEADAVLKEVQQEMSQAAADLDFDLTGSADSPQVSEAAENTEDETLMPNTEAIEDIVQSATEDETLLPGTADSSEPVIDTEEGEDETLMPGSFEMPAEALEPETDQEAAADSSGYENFFDLTGDDEEGKKS